MFEEHQHDRHHAGDGLTPLLPYVSASDVTHISLLVWGEHCIECAAPGCYATCDLYTRRPDGRCRRFAFGAKATPAFSSFRGVGTEIQFRKWAKLEARGNTRLARVRVTRFYETAMHAAFKVLNPVGAVLKRMTGDDRWGYLSHSLHERLIRLLHRTASDSDEPDAFLLEIYNPGAASVTLHFAIAPALGANGSHVQISAPPFQASIVAPISYSRHEFDRRLFRKITQRPFDVSLTPQTDTEPHLVFLSADFVRFRKAAGQNVSNIKCVVWDLDNTLWDGVLLENPNVQLRPGVLDVLHYLDDRGILLAIASKNDHDSAWSRLVDLGIAHLFLFPQINWAPKSESIKEIARRLDIGIDALAFVDDTPFELEEVGSAVRDVLCINAADTQSIPAHPRIQGSTTADARARRLFYQQAVVRQQEEAAFGDNYLSFLASCNITLHISDYHPDDLERIAELVQRTNQLNFSGRKYSRAQLYEVLDDQNLSKYVLKCDDKYGSYGTIGFSVVRTGGDDIHVDDFMVSCRVQGKFLEQAFFAHLLQAHNPNRSSTLWVEFTPTAKNKPAQKVLETLGFRAAGSASGMCTTRPLACEFIHVACQLPH